MENLKALVFGKKLTSYQRALAQREFKNMEERLELLEKVIKNNTVLPHVVGRSELLCQYEPDNTTSMNCKHCGEPKWAHQFFSLE
jgi:hypothetical protein